LSAKGTSYRQWNEQLSTYASCDFLKKEYGYWKDVLSNYVPLPVDFEHDQGVTYQETAKVDVSLPSNLTHKLVHETHDKYGTEINDILVSALSMSLTDWIDAPKVVIALEGHGREELFKGLDIGRTVGWFTSVYPICLNIDDIDDINALIADTKDMLRGVPNKGIGFNVLRFGTNSEEIKSGVSSFYEDLTFNYLGSFDNGRHIEQNSMVGMAPESTGLNVGMKNKNPHKLIVDCSIRGGSLHMEWKYDTTRYEKTTVQTLANAYLSALEKIIAHNDLSLNVEEFYEEEDFSISLI
jgi:non-ribosomal peptide synthase protein (TIGR01720 family)